MPSSALVCCGGEGQIVAVRMWHRSHYPGGLYADPYDFNGLRIKMGRDTGKGCRLECPWRILL